MFSRLLARLGLKRPAKFVVPTISFVGEQDGPVEQALKLDWSATLASSPSISAAYLAKATYGADVTRHVILCLRANGKPDSAVVAHLHEPFVARFKTTEKLDIAFISAEQERMLQPVCKAFYVAA